MNALLLVAALFFMALSLALVTTINAHRERPHYPELFCADPAQDGQLQLCELKLRFVNRHVAVTQEA